MSERRYDVCVIGAGLVGLGVARALIEQLQGISVLVLDKEDRVAAHQSSHNSGVVHSGLYYKPGSLKARLCVEGREETYAICEANGIAAKRCGKLVVATHESQLGALDELERRGRANGLNGLERVGPSGIRDHEPEARGISALYVPDAGVVDYPALAAHQAATLERAGAAVLSGQPVTAIEHRSDGVVVVAAESFHVRAVVNCAGLQSDRVARLAGVSTPIRIVPFRGEYYRLAEEKTGLVRALVYPVPDPRFPFLGVHFTRRVDGVVEVGPNAVLALGREQYRGVSPNWPDVWETLRGSGFRRLAMRHWLSGTRELMSSRSRHLYARLARNLIPATRGSDLLTGGAGVRAQAVSPDGSLVDDFVIEEAGNSLHVLNAPSPGATASIAIGRYVASKVAPIITA